MSDATGIQLDRAEFDEQQAPAACATCASALRDQYYEVNGSMVCTACHGQLNTTGDWGTRSSRIVRAVGAGSLAALGGAVVYWAILALTGYEFGLIAVVVGIAVGKAVNWGSRGKGGWRYQTVAIVLTYLAMVSAYVPLMMSEISKLSEAETSGAQTTGTPTGESSSAAPTEDPTLLSAVIGIAFLIGFACALPFLAGVENILGILILGFGLYEAWKLNRRVEQVITGPHTIATVQAG